MLVGSELLPVVDLLLDLLLGEFWLERPAEGATDEFGLSEEFRFGLSEELWPVVLLVALDLFDEFEPCFVVDAEFLLDCGLFGWSLEFMPVVADDFCFAGERRISFVFWFVLWPECSCIVAAGEF